MSLSPSVIEVTTTPRVLWIAFDIYFVSFCFLSTAGYCTGVATLCALCELAPPNVVGWGRGEWEGWRSRSQMRQKATRCLGNCGPANNTPRLLVEDRWDSSERNVTLSRLSRLQFESRIMILGLVFLKQFVEQKRWWNYWLMIGYWQLFYWICKLIFQSCLSGYVTSDCRL